MGASREALKLTWAVAPVEVFSLHFAASHIQQFGTALLVASHQTDEHMLSPAFF